MTDIRCSECGTMSATPRAHQNHICRPVDPIQVAPPVPAYDTARNLKARGMTPEQGWQARQAAQKAAQNAYRWQERVRNKMANIVLCDRCGAIATDKVAGGMELCVSQSREPEFFGLCPGCIEELWRWLKSDDTQNRPMIAYKREFDPDTVPEPVTNPAETTERSILDGD